MRYDHFSRIEYDSFGRLPPHVGKLNQQAGNTRRGVQNRIAAQRFQYGDFVTTLKFGTPKTVLPGLQGERAAVHFLEPHPAEELRDVCESENGMQLMFTSFRFERCDN